MIVTIDEMEAEIRRAVGTVWVDEGRLVGTDPGCGVDCIGLIECPAKAKGFLGPDQTIRAYGMLPVGRELEQRLPEYLDRVAISDMRRCDVVALSWNDPTKTGDDREAHHLGWLARHVKFPAHLALIHAAREVKKPRNDNRGEVVDHILDARWRSRIVSVWRLRGIA